MKLFFALVCTTLLTACANPQREELKWQCYGDNTTPRVVTQVGIHDNYPYHDCEPTRPYDRPQRLDGR